MLQSIPAVALVAFATTFSGVCAQTHTACNPLEKDCPPNPALGKNVVDCDFTKGACDAFKHQAGREVSYDKSRGLVCSMDAPVQAPTLITKEYIFFGRVEVEMQAAPGAGIVSTLVFESDDLDEIDYETVGNDPSHIQTNIFSKGNQTDHSNGGFSPVDDCTGKSHTYAVDWTPDKLEWYIDGTVARTLLRSQAGAKFPSSPMQIRVGAWVAGYKGADPDTTSWAGGEADFSNGPSTAYYKSIKITDYAGGSSATTKDVKEYSYGDRSGSASSIQIKLKDGSTTTGGESSGSSSSSSSESSSHTSAEPSSSTESSSSSASGTTSASPHTSSTASASSTTGSKTSPNTTSSGAEGSTTPSATTKPNSASTNGGAFSAVVFGVMALAAMI
ncbi:hypothetical protein NLG97_g6609 [Lecanicillium saksenae]|uniref:Uncharacterized protein n=1 Tax=Lecanicillium saksenae TaxID=468837 RepID=A0ACC1QR11_9HYPO|nr:hypothetical protein NLG97_g6609 [Lecanicillium saksenae]